MKFKTNTKITFEMQTLLVNKAKKSPSKRTKISAIAFNSKGDILGMTTNNFIDYDAVSWCGAGKHAERILMSRFGRKIATILICRSSKSGQILPIEPCPICKKVADKLGIKIITVMG